MRLMSTRFFKAVAFSTWIYSLLFLAYLIFRLTINSEHVHLDDLFIDRVPFFTFFITSVCLLVINLASLAWYLAIRRIQRRRKASIESGDAELSFMTITKMSILAIKDRLLGSRSESKGPNNLRLKTFIIWSFSVLVWSFLTYLSLARPPSPPYWPISMVMFVVGYICMVYMMAARDSRAAPQTA